jgi:hypothetical protein
MVIAPLLLAVEDLLELSREKDSDEGNPIKDLSE